jgi:hypothetical protein
MPEPVLHREVELPRSRSSGAAVVLVAAVAMFTAVGASAFVVRVRMQEAAKAASAASPVPPESVPVSLVRAPVDVGPLSDVDQNRVEAFEQARTAGDLARALALYNKFPPDSKAVKAVAVQRDEIATQYLKDELDLLMDEVDRRDCAAVDLRLAQLGQLLPEKQLPKTMDGCR